MKNSKNTKNSKPFKNSKIPLKSKIGKKSKKSKITDDSKKLDRASTLVQQKQKLEDNFFNLLSGDYKKTKKARLIGTRNAHTAKTGKRVKLFSTSPLSPSPTRGPSGIVNTQFKKSRPQSTRVNYIRGKPAFRKYGVATKRLQTAKRLDKFYMRTFNQPPSMISHHPSEVMQEIDISSRVYRN